MAVPRPIAHRLIRGGAIGLAAVAVVSGLALAAAYGLAQSDGGRAWIAQRLAAALSTPGESEISIARLEPGLPGEIRLAGLSVADGEGTWLSVGRVAVDWRPWALLSGDLHLTDVRVDDVRVARAPRPADTTAETPGGLPILPLNVTVERLSVADVVLDESVLGEAAAFRIAGEAAARENGQIATTLQVDRTDGGTGGARIDALFDPHAERLELDVAVNEPAGGLIARALDAPDLPALTVYLAGVGPLTDWHGDLAVTLEDLASVKAALALARDDGLRFRVSGTAASTRPAAGLPWRLMAGDVSFAADGAWSDRRVLTLAQARMESDAVDVRLDGRLAAADLGLDGRMGVQVKDPTLLAVLLPDSRAEELTIEAEASGPLWHPKLTVALAADRLTIPGWDARGLGARLTAAPDGPMNRPGARAAITLAGTIEDLAAADLADVEPLLGRRYAWDVAGDLDVSTSTFTASDLAVHAGPVTANGPATAHLLSGEIETALRIVVSDLAGLGPLLDMGVQGRAEGDARLSVLDYGSTIAISVRGHLADLRVDDPIADALLAGRAEVSGDLTLPGNGRLEMRNIVLESPAAKLTGAADLTSRYRQVQATYEVRIADANVLSSALGARMAGQAVVTGTAEGLARNPAFAGRIEVDTARIEGVDLGRLEADVRAEDLTGDPRGAVAFTATAPVRDLAGSADFVVAGRAVRLTALRLGGQGTSANGELTIPFSGAPMTGTAAIDIADLAPWLIPAGIDAGGAGTAKVRLSASGARQVADVDGTITNPVWRQANGTAVTAEQAAVTGRIDDLLGTRAGRLSVHAAHVAAGDARLASLSAEATGDLRQADVRLTAEGTWRGPLSLQAGGRVRLEENGWSVDLTGAEGRVLGQPVALQAPATVASQGKATTLSPLELAFGNARLRLEAHVDATRIAAEARLDDLDLNTLADLWPEAALAGDVSGTVSIAGSRDNPAGTGRLSATNVKTEAAAQAPPVGVDVTADWRDGRLQVAGRITGTPERDAELAADVPLQLDAETLALHLPADAPITGHAAWHGEMASILPLLPLDGHSLTGAAALDVKLAGSLAAPQVSGQIKLTGGAYENFDTGTILKDVALRIDLDDDRAVLSEFQATDGRGGRLSASGQVALDPARMYPFNLETEAATLAVVHRDDVTAVASGTATFAGDLDQALLRGAITTDTIEVRIIDRLPAEVVVLDVVETGTTGKIAAAKPAEDKAGGGLPVTLDMGLSMPRRVYVRGRGLESEWAGAAKVIGTAGTPLIEGELRLVRGQMTVLSKTFRLTKGTVSFPGGEQIVPALDVTAEHKAKDLTVTARISGPATNPTVTLASLPPLPRDEIVSRVLFGKAATQLSALEAAQLGAAVAELSGTGGGAGQILDFARTFLGVDVLRVDTATADDAAGPGVEAGKYLRDDVYVSVKKGVTDESGSVGVEIELTPNISVESETDSTGQSDIGIKFKWDY
ncbi:MAG TPA: translocation/assembly module TamB domain-containing protein [Kiloniellales bacterium]